MIHEWASHRRNVFFTPDGRTLSLAAADEFSFWDVETLKLSRRIRRDVAHFPSHVAFSPDGRLMAMEMAPGVTHLKDVSTARTVAKLEDPGGDRTVWMGFTPDGTQLVAAAKHAEAIHVWDLRLIRAGLKAMGLDWDWPEFAPATGPDKSRPPNPESPLRLDVAGAESQAPPYVRPCGSTRTRPHAITPGAACARAGEWGEAAAALASGLKLVPMNHERRCHAAAPHLGRRRRGPPPRLPGDGRAVRAIHPATCL